jgi:hypothetical protein
VRLHRRKDPQALAVRFFVEADQEPCGTTQRVPYGLSFFENSPVRSNDEMLRFDAPAHNIG